MCLHWIFHSIRVKLLIPHEYFLSSTKLPTKAFWVEQSSHQARDTSRIIQHNRNDAKHWTHIECLRLSTWWKCSCFFSIFSILITCSLSVHFWYFFAIAKSLSHSVIRFEEVGARKRFILLQISILSSFAVFQCSTSCKTQVKLQSNRDQHETFATHYPNYILILLRIWMKLEAVSENLNEIARIVCKHEIARTVCKTTLINFHDLFTVKTLVPIYCKCWFHLLFEIVKHLFKR